MTLILSTTIVNIAEARDYYSHPSKNECVREFWTMLSERNEKVKTCEVAKSLKLAQGEFNYPLINVGILKVRYWEAQMVTTYTSTQTYEHSFVNVCNGLKTFSEVKEMKSQKYKSYVIDNPNLDSSLTKSYELAPMTNEEAKNAFLDLKKNCEADVSLEN